MYYREYRTMEHIGITYSVSESRVCEIIQEMESILISDKRVYVVDWPWARSGAAWVDWVAFAPSVAMQGGPDPESLLRRFDVGGVAPKAIDAVLCSLAGYFVIRSLAPAPAGLPTLRAFQAAQGRQAIAWLRERTGWD